MPRSKELQDLIRKSENPYAVVEIESQELEMAAAAPETAHRSEFRLRQNPHAHDFYFGETGAESTTAIPDREAATGELAKAQFEQRAREIFRSYIPAAENGRLRPQYRDFIARNKSRSPQVRYGLIQRLAKYDLSSQRGFKPQFNREREIFTQEKLAEIETLFKDEG
jgi:hypothetical protein